MSQRKFEVGKAKHTREKGDWGKEGKNSRKE